MDQQYVYEEEQEEEGLTFKKIGYFFKKAWVRLIVYAVIAALVATAIAVPIKVFVKSEPVAQTSVEFIYKGVEEGLNPNGGALDTDNIISMTVLKDAVDSANLGGTITDITKLRASMRVEGVKTDEYLRLAEAAANGDSAAANALRSYVMHPTQFDIVITDPEELGLSDDQAVLLLDKIVQSYGNDFRKRFSVTAMFATDMYTLAEDRKNEFVYVYDIYTASLETMGEYLSSRAKSDPTFVSTINNSTFALLVNELNVLINRYAAFNATILSNKILRTDDYATILSTSEDEINAKLNPLKEYISALTTQLGLIEPNTTTSDSAGVHQVVVTYPPEYYEYHSKLDAANKQKEEYEVQLKNIENRKKNFADAEKKPDALIAQKEGELAELEARTRAFVEKANATISDYFDTTFVASSLRQVRPPVVTRRMLDFNLLVVYAAAVIAGVVVASVVTGIKIARRSAANKAAEKDRAKAEQSKDEDTKDKK